MLAAGVSTARLIWSFPIAVRLLLVNQFGVNTAFYLLIPYLATHLRGEIGMSAAAVGIVLGMRTLSQQGLFLLGGTASDRIGPRTVIIAGCALRAVGFGIFALGASLPLLLVASVLSGLAGALFNPAVRAYVALEAGERKAEAFSLFNMFATAGSLAGPLIGSALLLVDFRVAALAAAGIFVVLTIAQAAVLPRRPVVPSKRSVLADWRLVFADRRFIAFTAAVAGMFALETQLYLVLPIHAERFTGTSSVVASLFLVSTVATLLLQLRITRAAKARLRREQSIAAGLAVMGAGFLATGAAAAVIPAVPPQGTGEGMLRLVPVLITVLALAVGGMLAQPFVYEIVGDLGGERLAGTYFGVYYLAAGVVGAGANAFIGAVIDVWGARWPWMPALICALIGLGSAAAVLRVTAGLPKVPAEPG